MKLWLLRPRDDIPDEWDPWHHVSGHAWGFVVRAENELSARVLAAGHAGDESSALCRIWRNPTDKAKAWWNPQDMPDSPWILPRFTTCEELTTDGPEGVILRDMTVP